VIFSNLKNQIVYSEQMIIWLGSKTSQCASYGWRPKCAN